MYSPILASRFAELPRPVERVYYPNPLAAQPLRSVLALFRKEPVMGVAFADGGGQELVRSGISQVPGFLGR